VIVQVPPFVLVALPTLDRGTRIVAGRSARLRMSDRVRRAHVHELAVLAHGVAHDGLVQSAAEVAGEIDQRE
jgi:hypothetical protein